MIAFLQRKSRVSFALVYSLTYFGSRFNSPKETRYRPPKQKVPSFIPQCSLFQGEPRLYSARECLAQYFTCLFFVCLWQFLICFKAFITFWYNTKNTITTCISQRVIILLVQGTSGEENYSFSEFFTRFGWVDNRKVRALRWHDQCWWDLLFWLGYCFVWDCLVIRAQNKFNTFAGHAYHSGN